MCAGAARAESMPGLVARLSVLGTLGWAASALPRISSARCFGSRFSEQTFHKVHFKKNKNL